MIYRLFGSVSFRACLIGGVLFPVAILVAGCDSKDPVASTPANSKPSSTPPAGDKPSASPDAAKAPEAPKVDLDRSTLPSSLQTAAYHYYGLSNAKPLDYEITQKPVSAVITGSAKLRLVKISGNEATFSNDTTGGLNDTVGNQTLTLKPDGVYEDSSSDIQMDHPALGLPSDVSKGKTWKLDTTVTAKGRKERQQITFVSMGEQPFTLDGQKYQGLYVEGTGTIGLIDDAGKVDGAPTTFKRWFLKDIGEVRQQIVQTPKGKPSVSLTMEWKPAKGGK